MKNIYSCNLVCLFVICQWLLVTSRPGVLPSRGLITASDNGLLRAPIFVLSKRWGDLIKRVWEVNPLINPQCCSKMRIISLIQDPDVIRRTLERLGL
jgi:hypothetical protein